MVQTPHIGKLDLYRTSGHYPYYRESQFPPIRMSGDGVGDDCCAAHANADAEEEGFLLKPMNCPHHIQIYKARQHSYRDLPLRLGEFGTVYRFEQSGELNGLTRCRGFTQDDAHIFCTPDQLESEVLACVELVKLVLAGLGLDDYRVRVGLRDPDSSKYTGEARNWDQAEQNLRNVVRQLDMNYAEEAGEAAFYGPKIDFVVRDCLGREWQLGTIQVDYNLPERFDLEYIGADNQAHRPVMVHRAPFGSMERFIGILIEHFAGAFPLWLAPVQLAVLPVSDKFNDYAREVVDLLTGHNVRVELDDSPEKVGAKIRRATLEKVPYMAIVGAREAEGRTVSLRDRTEGDLGELELDALGDRLATEISSKGAEPVATG
jgi:threonyl-tRNA synthetase